MDKELVDVNHLKGTQTHWHTDDAGRVVEQITYDINPVLDYAAAVRNELDFSGKELQPMMLIPEALFHKWAREGKLSEVPGGYIIDKAKLLELYRDPDYSRLRLQG
ncbi:MAG: hypothetical protein ACRCWJ_16425 [Casimicrobium sp.]